MPNKNYLRGRRWEYEVAKQLRKEGYKVMRTAGSHGPYDLIALGPNLIILIQCKVTKTEAAKKRLVNMFGGIQEPNDDQLYGKHSRYGEQVIECLAIKVGR